MNLLRLFLVAGLIATLCLCLGCSDESKEEAARLEKELMEGEPPVGDTETETAEMAPDTSTPEMTDPDAGAVVAEEPEPTPERLPEAPISSGYTVQVASCEDLDYAQHLVDLYRERGYEPFVATFTQDGQVYYRVRVGDFENHSDAVIVQEDLKDRFSVDSWIGIIGQ